MYSPIAGFHRVCVCPECPVAYKSATRHTPHSWLDTPQHNLSSWAVQLSFAVYREFVSALYQRSCQAIREYCWSLCWVWLQQSLSGLQCRYWSLHQLLWELRGGPLWTMPARLLRRSHQGHPLSPLPVSLVREELLPHLFPGLWPRADMWQLQYRVLWQDLRAVCRWILWQPTGQFMKRVPWPNSH